MTLPGYLHDVGAAFFPFADDSPAFRSLDLAGAGLRWRNARLESCHPAPDGTCVDHLPRPRANRALVRRRRPGLAAPGACGRRAWATGWPRPCWRRCRASGPPAPRAACNLLRLARPGLTTTAGFARRHFQTEAARRVIPGLALHVDLGPEDFAGTGLGLVLALLAAGSGFRVPVGGARCHHRRPCCADCRKPAASCGSDTRVERIVVRQRPGRGGADRRAATRSPCAGRCWPTWGRRPCSCKLLRARAT